MSTLENCHEPGILLVLSRPTSPEYLPEVHAWYDTEHGPARLRLGKQYFSNGYRYKSLEDDTWLAMYDMNDLTAGSDKAYTRLRENRSRREQDVLDHKSHALSRQFLRLLTTSTESSTPAKIIYLARLSVPAGVENIRKSDSVSNSLSPMGCARVRMFGLVDGTDIESRESLLTVACDFNNDVSTKSMNQIRDAVISGVPGSEMKSAGFFVFYRAFSADEYVPPPEIGATKVSSTSAHEMNGLRERL